MNKVVESWREESTDSPLLFSSINVCKNLTGINVEVQFNG